MPKKLITIEDIDILFNGDKRGRQFFLINTDGLHTFDINNLADEKSDYGKVRKALKDSTEYKEVQTILYTNINTFKTTSVTPGSYSSDIIAYNDEYIKKFVDGSSGTPDLQDNPYFLNVKNVTDFVDSIYNKITSESDTYENIITGSDGKDSISDLDKYVSDKLKQAWREYKITDNNKYKSADIKKSLSLTDIANISAPFDEDDFIKEKIIILNDKYHKIKKSGDIEPFDEDKHKCKSYGFNTEGDNCDVLLYECLVNPSGDNLSTCIKKISDSMTNYNISNQNLQNMNPEIVLALLHRFGFKAIKDNNGKKKIISVASWKKYILPSLKITITDDGSLTNVDSYLQNLVDYINSKPELLNSNNFTTNDFYDPVTNKDKFGRSVDPSKTNKTALEGLSQFYEARKFYRSNQTNFSDYLRDIYDIYGFKVPKYLQSGGANSRYKLLKAEMDNGNTGVKYLTRIYNSLKSSLTNVDISVVETEIDKFLAEIQKNENELLKYIEFVDKVNNIYHLFKYAPSKVQLTGTDINELNDNLNNKIQEYQAKENKVAQFIQALAKKELNPYTENSVFDI